jgi:hypothetical protein
MFFKQRSNTKWYRCYKLLLWLFNFLFCIIIANNELRVMQLHLLRGLYTTKINNINLQAKYKK